MTVVFHEEVRIVRHNIAVVDLGFYEFVVTISLLDGGSVAVVHTSVFRPTCGAVGGECVTEWLRVVFGAVLLGRTLISGHARCVRIEMTTLLVHHILDDFFAQFTTGNSFIGQVCPDPFLNFMTRLRTCTIKFDDDVCVRQTPFLELTNTEKISSFTEEF